MNHDEQYKNKTIIIYNNYVSMSRSLMSSVCIKKMKQEKKFKSKKLDHI
jgi:hypothetical protein